MKSFFPGLYHGIDYYSDIVKRILLQGETRRKSNMHTAVLLLAGMLTVNGGCPKLQVPHNTSTGIVCCQPVLVCPRGSQIKFCTSNAGDDTCEKCPQGWHGNFITSSLDANPEQCFQYSKKHETCALDDNAWIEVSKAKHGMPCRCDESRCYHGSPSEYGCIYKECGSDAQLDPYTGECEPCGPLRFKNDICGSCLVNETAWRLSAEKQYSPGNDKIQSHTSAVKGQTDSNDVAVTTHEPPKSEPYPVDGEAVRPLQATCALAEDNDQYRKVIIIALVLCATGNLLVIILYIRRNFKKKHVLSTEHFYINTEYKDDLPIKSRCTCKVKNTTISCLLSASCVCNNQTASFV
ncbi:uncharacterized protein LOC127841661 isoform X2 [Dreissena polymorpha]|uniref:uncharacterized protein LOC127841661 isoform X2 n=1 Tax=Dreissena polymorpha TaxID=45954 RepID=UPI002264A6A4|nr:uncharacterized protein LOC127841661 isoform X2 [Dreissena polymorpha]